MDEQSSIWDSLSDYVVSAKMVNTFKRRLDKFLSDQDVLYNYEADHGIRNHSTYYSVIFCE